VSFLTLTFRGIPFLWKERGGEDDKRFVEHDFPTKVGRWHEDMAAGPRVFTFDAFLLGGNVDIARAKLRLLHQACRDQRPGTLTHPIYGSVRCVNTGFKWKESIDELNRISLDLTFEEDNQADQPIASRWIGSALADAVDAARDAISGALDQVWDLVSMPAYVLDAGEDALADLAAQVFGTLGLLTAPVRAAVSGQMGIVQGIGVEADTIATPFMAVFSSYTTDDNGRLLQLTADQAATTYAALTPLATWTLGDEPLNTTSRAIAAQALAGLSASVRRASVLEMANLTRLMSFASADEAIALRDSLADAMDVEVLAAADQASIDSNPVAADVSTALNQARAEMIADLTLRAASLKPVGHVTLTQTVPAVVLAYQLYGDRGSAGDRANTLSLVSDIANRNGVVDPGQMPGGVPLEYLASS
jgi:prophage DNA circulation protein